MRCLPALPALCALGLLLSACGGDAGGKGTSSGSDARTATAPKAPAPVQAGRPAKAIAGMDGTVDGAPARLDIISLTRSGGVSQLTMRLSNTDPQDSSSGIQVGDTFDDQVNGTEAKPDDPFTVDGVALVDSVNRKKYLVARDTEGKCVCDSGLSSEFVKAEQSLNLSATFGAPPPAVRTVNVFVPKFGTFRDVPIT